MRNFRDICEIGTSNLSKIIAFVSISQTLETKGNCFIHEFGQSSIRHYEK